MAQYNYGISYSGSTSAILSTTPYSNGLYSFGGTSFTESIEDIVYHKVIMKVGNIDKNNVCMKRMKAWLKKQI